MKHNAIVTLSSDQSIKLSVTKLDEFIRGYWGQENYFISSDLGYCDINIVLESAEYGNSFSFTAFRDIKYFEYLNVTENLCPKGKEIFAFKVDNKQIEITFYNSFDTIERELQFLKIASGIEEFLKSPLQLLRFVETAGTLIVMCKHHRGSKIGFDFIPCNDFDDADSNVPNIFIGQTDFEYLYQFIKHTFPQEWNNMEIFDFTGDNFIRREDWMQIIKMIKNHKPGDRKIEAFYEYMVDWLEKQLIDYSFICLYGNL